MTPDDRQYTRSHEWVRMDGVTAAVGITDHAQGELGDVTFVDLPAVGTTVAAGEACGVIESVKAAGDIYAPVGGDVAEVNEALGDAPGLVNRDPYGQGWLFRLSNVGADAVSALLSAAEYESAISR